MASPRESTQLPAFVTMYPCADSFSNALSMNLLASQFYDPCKEWSDAWDVLALDSFLTAQKLSRVERDQKIACLTDMSSWQFPQTPVSPARTEGYEPIDIDSSYAVDPFWLHVGASVEMKRFGKEGPSHSEVMVLSPPREGGKILVVFQHERSSPETGFFARISSLRPLPPPTPPAWSASTGSVVEVFVEKRWWRACVTDIAPTGGAMVRIADERQLETVQCRPGWHFDSERGMFTHA